MSLLLPKDVAQRWRCSEKHVRKMINTGRLRGFRIGGKLLRVRLWCFGIVCDGCGKRQVK